MVCLLLQRVSNSVLFNAIFSLCIALPSTGCNDGDVRLVARESEASGQVEVCFRNEWGRICSNLWDVNAAMVVCRQLQLNYTEGI